MFYWTSEIAGKVKEILIINPQQCGPEPQIFAVGERRRRAGAGKGACFAPGGWRTRLLGRSRCFCEGRCAWRRTFRGADRRGFGGDFGGDSIRAGAGASGGGGCGVERCRDERADVACAAQSSEAERAEGKRSGMRAGNAARKVRSAEPGGRSTEAPRGKEGRKRRVSFGRARRVWTVDSGRFSPAFSPSARGGRNAGSLKRGAEESDSSEISLIRAAEARGKAGASEKGRSEDSRGAEPGGAGRASAKISGAGIVEERGGVYRCLAARFLLYPSCGALFSGAPPTLVS